MTLTRSGDEIAAYFAEAMAALQTGGGARPTIRFDPMPTGPRYNLAPTQDALTLVQEAPPEVELTDPATEANTYAFEWKRWGLVPAWAKDPSRLSNLFNARGETVATKPSFRSAFARRRCLVIADGFYEWTPRNQGHQPYFFAPEAVPLWAFAGLHEVWHGEGGEVIESCTVLTTEANSDLEGVHHRMPVILPPESFAPWLAPDATPEHLASWIRPAPAGTMARRPVSRHVNNARHDDPGCLADWDPKAEENPVGTPSRGRAVVSGAAAAAEQGELFGASGKIGAPPARASSDSKRPRERS